jgi:hypothetical protein
MRSSLQSAVTTGEVSTATFPSCAGSSVDHLHWHHLIHGERLAKLCMSANGVWGAVSFCVRKRFYGEPSAMLQLSANDSIGSR